MIFGVPQQLIRQFMVESENGARGYEAGCHEEGLYTVHQIDWVGAVGEGRASQHCAPVLQKIVAVIRLFAKIELRSWDVKVLGEVIFASSSDGPYLVEFWPWSL